MSDILVLCYHAVSPKWPAALSVTPAALRGQLELLISRGWQGITFGEAVAGHVTARRNLAVTFDDAFRSVLELGLPILDSLGLPGTLFAPTAFISTPGRGAWPGVEHWSATEHADELQFMDWEDLTVLADRGWEIGSHTRTHPRLTQLDDAQLTDELQRSRDECSAHLQRECQSIAYPYGDVDERVASAAAAAGYRAGAALSSSLVPYGPLRQPRVGVYHADSHRRFRLKVASVVRRLRASPVWTLAG